MDKLKVVDAAWHGMKGAWGMAKDQLTGDSGDDKGGDGGRALIDRLPVLRGRGRLLLQPVPMRLRVGAGVLQSYRGDGAEGSHAPSMRRYKCCVCSMCGCLLEWGICFGRRGGDGPCCFDCCWCPCCP